MAFSHCAQRAELEDVIDLAKGLGDVDALIDDDVPLKPTLIGFIERNLRLVGR